MDEYRLIGIHCQGLEVPDAPVKTLIRFSVPALCALLVCGCWNGRVLLAFEEPFWASLGEDIPARISLARETIPHGYFPRFLLVRAPDDPVSRLLRELSYGGYRAAVVGPLASYQWRGYAAKFTHTRFILLSEENTPDLPANALQVRYDRTDAFRAAGFAAGVSVREEGGGDGGGLRFRPRRNAPYR